MEPIGTFSDGEWDYFRRMFSTDEQFLSQSSLLLSEDVELNNESMFYSFNDHAHDHISNSQYISQENSYSSNCSSDNNAVLFSNHDHTNYYLNPDNNVLANSASFVSMDFYMDEKKIASSVPSLDDIVMDEDVKLNEDAGKGSDHRLEMPTLFPTNQLQMQLKRKLDVLEMEVPPEDNINNKSENQKKKPRSLKDGQGRMKNARSKKNQKVGSCNGEEAEETNNRGSNRQSSSSNISEDDNASQENNGGATSESISALNSNGKTRASRGSATDPQSLYAKKRRERINERLRILQNLVPNGTKVDISTMLEEAVNYVKFLQLQIKLLSSDDLWMYAPLAYNGLDIGLNLNLDSSPQL